VSNSVPLAKYDSGRNVTFAANDTYYDYTGGGETALGVDGLYTTGSLANKFPSSLYTVLGNTIKINANGTSGVYPNTTTGGIYYVDYNYQSANANSTFTNVSGSIWSAFQLIAIVLIVIAAVAILAYFGFGMRE
jgi:hypothetical protein